MAVQDLDQTLINTGRGAAAADILTVARDNLCAEFAMSALWYGAKSCEQQSRIKAMKQRDAVIDAAFSGPPYPFVRGEDMVDIMTYIGELGEDRHVIQAGLRAQGQPRYVQALVAGANTRITKSIKAGTVQKLSVCRAILAGLPDHALKSNEAIQSVAAFLAAHGNEADLVATICHYRDDPSLQDIMHTAAEAHLQEQRRAAADGSFRVSDDIAARADLVLDLFKTTRILPPPPPSTADNGSVLVLPKRRLKL